MFPLVFSLRALALGAVLLAPLGAWAQTAPPETAQAGPPLREGARVLFRFHAPAGAQKVFLAGSFNNWADNQNGAVTDDKFALAKTGDGFYWTSVAVEPKVEQYKFVVRKADGQWDWLADPQVAATDAQGNSVLDFGKIGRLAPSANRQGAPLRAGDQVLFRFQAPADAVKVYLAGSFNNFADNENGVVRDEKFAMTPLPNGLYTKRETIGATTEKYKFVVVNQDDQTTWVADPNVALADANGNSVVDFGAIERLP